MSKLEITNETLANIPSYQTISTLSNDYYYGSPITSEREKEMDKNKFLEIKRQQELDAIDKEYKSKEKEILKQDIIQIKISKLQQEINSIYKEEESLYRVDFSTMKYSTSKTNERLKELERKRDEKKDKIIKKYEEITALVDDMSSKDKIDIYKMYDII